MDKKRFQSLLSAEARERISSLTDGYPDKKEIIYSTASGCLDEKSIPNFEELIKTESFANFLQVRKNNSPGRISGLIFTVLDRVSMEIPNPIVERMLAALAGKAFITTERSFYMVPPDPEAYKEFEKNFVRTFEQNSLLVDDLLAFFLSEHFLNFKKIYRNDFPTYSLLQKRLIDLFLAKQNKAALDFAADFLCREPVSRFIKISCNLKSELTFINLVFLFLFSHSDPNLFFRFLKAYHIRYTFKNKSAKQDEKIFLRLMTIWPVVMIFRKENLDDFREFLALYGNLADEFETFVWDQVFLLQAEKIPKVITLLSSASFQSLSQFYGADKDTVKFLIRNIIAALAEIQIRNLNITLSRIILKLLLNLKVDRNFLKRRALFFHILKSTTSSLKMELEVVRFIFFEYIFIASKAVKSDYYIEFTKFCDDDHRFFCEIVDKNSRNKIIAKLEDKKKYFLPLIERIRSIVWKPYLEKFENSYHFNQVQSIAISTDKEDEVMNQLEKVEQSEIFPYCNSLLDVFKTHPEHLDEAIQSDYWYRLTLPEASPYALSSVLTLVGTVEILEGQSGAYTDGKTIFLPGYINRFKDPLEPIIQNRNLTLYIGMALHEAGHILAGTFRFNMFYYLSRLEKPKLFHDIHNILEDLRIEEFLRRIHAHPQVTEIFLSMNEYFSFQNIQFGMNLFQTFFMCMSDESTGMNVNLKTYPWYDELMEKVFKQSANCGRFRNLKDLFYYGVERLRNLDIGNPLAVYPLTREMYEICKHWPDSFFEEKESQENCFRRSHERTSDAMHSKPLTESELNDLYREYNENPELFLGNNGLKVFPELLSEGEDAVGSSLESASEKRSQFINDIVDIDSRVDYTDNGTVDFSHRTKADNLSAEEKLLDKKKYKPNDLASRLKKKSGTKKKKYIYSIDPKTRSRTKISEIREFVINEVNNEFMKYFRKWDFVSVKVYRMLSSILPNLRENIDNSAFDGELNMEILTEILSDKPTAGTAEIFDIFVESRRSLEVIVGLDASGSTARTIDKGSSIFDIEKTFAIIFARAIRHLTDNVRVYCFDSMTSTNVYRAISIDAVSSFKIGNANRDGDFVRYVNLELSQSNAERKYFFLISDGQPSAENYFGKEALDDTLIAFRESKNAGVKLIYFNVDSEKQEYFEAFRKEATYAEYFRHPEDLLPAIPEIVKTIALSIL